MRCWSLLLLALACNGQESDDSSASKSELDSTGGEETPTDDEEEETPRDIPHQDTSSEATDEEIDADTAAPASPDTDTDTPPESDTSTPPVDSAEPTPIDIDIEPGQRWEGRFTPSVMFGEMRWETARPDGTRCLIEGLMTDIVQREDSCTDCDFGIQFTLTGLIILLDEGACDMSVLDWEGRSFEYGHGHTQMHTEVDSDVFDLYRLTEDGWMVVERGFGRLESSEVVWVFGEELASTFGSDGPSPVVHASTSP